MSPARQRHDHFVHADPDRVLAPPRTGHLDIAQRQTLRAVLLRRRDALLAAVRLHESGEGRVAHAAEVLAQDGDDAPQRDADREVDLAQSDQARVELAQVLAALARLDGPEFGRCQQCGDDIAWARLQACPEAGLCIACAVGAERVAGAWSRPSM
ncbi:TraR/DksA family transcriptional regulator [Sphaerotilus mobilis]|uniref:TraR/DksA family transcriptional regulator n=1 Tax=Sphaerotilus mobilis TaxID=47994 RepID=A0A4Q7LB27_9BURK|nr:TraR/DksA family transcriptional regulator [Sphaerotilus mobilis]RZS46850.1 TraR/DksA family transcriptional regulator [Sphaerotilus mobilis]